MPTRACWTQSNVTLRAIVGAIKTTPIEEMEKGADLEIPELRRTLEVLTQTEKVRRLTGHPFHNKLAAPTKKKKAKKTEPHTFGKGPKENTRRHSGSTDQWGQTSSVVQSGTRKITEQPSSWKHLVYSLLNNRYQHNRPWLWGYFRENTCRLIGHIYSPTAQWKMLLEMVTVACLSGSEQDKQLHKCYKQKMLKFQSRNLSTKECSSLHSKLMKPQKTIILIDSKATLQSLISNTSDQSIHQLLKDLQLLSHECTVVL